MPLLGGIAGFVDKYLLGYALGTAAGPALEPYAQDLANLGWRANQVKPLDPVIAAQLVAQRIWSQSQAQGEANNLGFTDYIADSLVKLAEEAPAAADVRTMRRRGIIGLDLLHHAYEKAQIEPQFWPALDQLLHEHLSPQVVALAIVRGLIPDPGILPVSPPTGDGSVPRFPVFNLDAEAEAESEGLDLTRLSVLAGLAGRPMSPEAAAEAYFKGILELVDFQRAVSESDVRNEWRDAILENQRYRLRPADWAGLWLRGWVTEQQAYDGGAQYGATPEMMRRLYQNRGRPATPRQVRIGYARGATHAGSANVSEAIQTAVRQSDIRTEWGDIEEAVSYSLPSAFVLRQLTTSGAITGDDAFKYLHQSGWPDELARKAADAWAPAGSAGPGTKWADRARSRVFSAAHDDYLDGNADEATARELLAAVGVGAAEQTTVLNLWNLERDRTRRDLTQAQIIKLYKRSVWDRPRTLAALDDLGMDPGDASDLLDA